MYVVLAGEPVEADQERVDRHRARVLCASQEGRRKRRRKEAAETKAADEQRDKGRRDEADEGSCLHTLLLPLYPAARSLAVQLTRVEDLHRLLDLFLGDLLAPGALQEGLDIARRQATRVRRVEQVEALGQTMPSGEGGKNE